MTTIQGAVFNTSPGLTSSHKKLKHCVSTSEALNIKVNKWHYIEATWPEPQSQTLRP